MVVSIEQYQADAVTMYRDKTQGGSYLGDEERAQIAAKTIPRDTRAMWLLLVAEQDTAVFPDLFTEALTEEEIEALKDFTPNRAVGADDIVWFHAYLLVKAILDDLHNESVQEAMDRR